MKDNDLLIINSFKYFIFDRDRNNNRPGAILKAIDIFKNSLDNETEINGLLLLSYPSIESFILMSKNDNRQFSCGKEIKQYSKDKYSIKDLKEDGIFLNYKNFSKLIYEIIKKDFGYEKLDNMGIINKQIFEHEEIKYNKTKVYDTISLLIVSFLDLGILEIIEN